MCTCVFVALNGNFLVIVSILDPTSCYIKIARHVIQIQTYICPPSQIDGLEERCIYEGNHYSCYYHVRSLLPCLQILIQY